MERLVPSPSGDKKEEEVTKVLPFQATDRSPPQEQDMERLYGVSLEEGVLLVLVLPLILLLLFPLLEKEDIPNTDFW